MPSAKPTAHNKPLPSPDGEEASHPICICSNCPKVKNVEERDKQITLQKLKARNIGIKALYPKKAMPDEPSAEPKKVKLPKRIRSPKKESALKKRSQGILTKSSFLSPREAQDKWRKEMSKLKEKQIDKEIKKINDAYAPLDEDDSGSDFAEKVMELNNTYAKIVGRG
jgi:hypothetical protein